MLVEANTGLRSRGLQREKWGPDPKSCAVGGCKSEAPPPSCDIFAQSFSAGGLF